MTNQTSEQTEYMREMRAENGLCENCGVAIAQGNGHEHGYLGGGVGCYSCDSCCEEWPGQATVMPEDVMALCGNRDCYSVAVGNDEWVTRDGDECCSEYCYLQTEEKNMKEKMEMEELNKIGTCWECKRELRKIEVTYDLGDGFFLCKREECYMPYDTHIDPPSYVPHEDVWDEETPF